MICAAPGALPAASYYLASASHTPLEPQAHPAERSLLLLLPKGFGAAELCVAYWKDRGVTRPNKGKVKVTVRAEYPGGKTRKRKFKGKVKNDRYSKCKPIPDLEAGTVVSATFAFTNFQSLPADQCLGSCFAFSVSAGGTPLE